MPAPNKEALPYAPRATYRLQFNKDFGFARATELADYLRRLGISHLYASSYLNARSGSTHGYDIVDHNSLNPEIGSRTEYAEMVAALQREGLGQILDFIPNHMGVGGSDNGWWLDVLEWGRDSIYAGYFDIDWDTEKNYLQGKILVPFLGEQYGKALENGEIVLKFDDKEGSFAVWVYNTHKLPINPLHYGRILGDSHPELERLSDAFAGLPEYQPHIPRRAQELKRELAALVAQCDDVAHAVEGALDLFNGHAGKPETFRALEDLIGDQHWRVAYFGVAADDINYRRFFNINELAGIRMDHTELFDIAHRLVFELIESGAIDGLRIDHIDGLLDPKRYTIRLRQRSARRYYLVVEKILGPDERLHEDWDVDGATGYDFANMVGGLFVDHSAERAFTKIYQDFTGEYRPFFRIVRECKIAIMENEMASELNSLARAAGRVARQSYKTCDFTENILHEALKQIIAGFSVYRTYVDRDGPSESDRRYIERAVEEARQAAKIADKSAFDFLQRLLTIDLVAVPKSGYSRESVVRLAMRIQQYSGPIMAKGLEDTAFYRYNRLVSLNEVGGNPEQFGTGIERFHRFNQERSECWPAAMLGTSTHDTKKGEDVRARLNVLTEMPEEWDRQVNSWSRILRTQWPSQTPYPNDEYLLYQLILGAWPMELTGADPVDACKLRQFADRLEAAMIKSVREAKLHSSWAAPDEEYERGVAGFLGKALDISGPNEFLKEFLPFQERVARAAVTNSLVQAVLKLTLPGVPDIYQGAELWDLSLVDPDNRRPIDFKIRRDLLLQVEESRAHDRISFLDKALNEEWRTGAVKLAVVHALLHLRKDHPDLFSRGDYASVAVQGPAADHVFSFIRRYGAQTLLVVVPRLSSQIDHLDGAMVDCPAGSRWQEAITGKSLDLPAAPVPAIEFFQHFPVAVCLSGA
ncbi:MAG TPA: malto-oligosyltrehalose synthase [Candidatus Acidoferrales bacterium]|nr:malto-oligosyltrehalose synthase [Candidatus Acidoferrales bacterium]